MAAVASSRRLMVCPACLSAEWAGCQRVGISPDTHRAPYHISFGSRSSGLGGRQRLVLDAVLVPSCSRLGLSGRGRVKSPILSTSGGAVASHKFPLASHFPPHQRAEGS